MVITSASVASELMALRKGRGIYVPQIGDRLGPVLREMCEVVPGDTDGEMRVKLAARLEELAAGLPADQQVAVLAALAIHSDARLPFYQDRIRWVARYLERDERTARRRVDYSIRQLARMAASVEPDSSTNDLQNGGEQSPGGWRTAELRSIVKLDAPGDREVVELRRIVAERDGLDELDLAVSLPQSPVRPNASSDLTIDVLYGGILVPLPAESSERISFLLRLPRPLARGEPYEYGLRFRVPAGQPVGSHYTLVSKRPCDQFDLRVRFAPGRLPRQAWRLAGALQQEVDDPIPTGEQVFADQAGDLHVAFRYLTPGLAYGLRWLGRPDAEIRLEPH